MKAKVESEYWERKKREILASFLVIPLKRMKNPLDKSAWYLEVSLVFAASLGLEAAGFLFLIFCFHGYTGLQSVGKGFGNVYFEDCKCVLTGLVAGLFHIRIAGRIGDD
ncbi:unnamed protein product [Vicia faba]|uniref:Uncharacterized protein n=1 Tax=Vicia faba TaxID=3906 RepID=A0AAV1AE97_VICFA|nr:unnamed protein product [Vicia faba]